MVTMALEKWRKVFSRFFFSGDEKKKLVQAICTAEAGTSAEIRIRLEKRNPKKTVLAQAETAFLKLRMHKTAGKNGVLILLCPNTQEIAVIGDEGIDQKVPAGFWKEIIEDIARDSKNGEILDGMVKAVLKIGHELKKYFPGAAHDRNELSDQIA